MRPLHLQPPEGVHRGALHVVAEPGEVGGQAPGGLLPVDELPVLHVVDVVDQSKVDAACELVLLGVARASSRLPGVLPRGPPPAPAPALQARLGALTSMLTISSQPMGDARHRSIVLRVCIHTSQVSLVQACEEVELTHSLLDAMTPEEKGEQREE